MERDGQEMRKRGARRVRILMRLRLGYKVINQIDLRKRSSVIAFDLYRHLRKARRGLRPIRGRTP